MTKEEQIKIIYDYMGWDFFCNDLREMQWCGEKTCTTCTGFHPLDGNDMIALKDKMVEKGDWTGFEGFCSIRWSTTSSLDFIPWLFSLVDSGEIPRGIEFFPQDANILPRFFRLFIESEVWKK